MDKKRQDDGEEYGKTANPNPWTSQLAEYKTRRFGAKDLKQIDPESESSDLESPEPEPSA